VDYLGLVSYRRWGFSSPWLRWARRFAAVGNFKPGMIIGTATGDPQHDPRAPFSFFGLGHRNIRSAWPAPRSQSLIAIVVRPIVWLAWYFIQKDSFLPVRGGDLESRRSTRGSGCSPSACPTGFEFANHGAVHRHRLHRGRGRFGSAAQGRLRHWAANHPGPDSCRWVAPPDSQ